EKNMVVKAHPKFRLFATQNPVGTYAGRKRLSRAFLNRFIVLRFDHPPFEELSQIVCTRCSIPKTASIAMINVLTELKRMRSQSALFNSTDGLMTLRDLFRWADRLSKSDSGEWRQVLADQGYFLLACRCRNSNDADAVVSALEKHLKVKIYPEKLFGLDSPYMPKEVKQMLEEGNTHIVATFAMRRMLILSSESWKCSEPILMVGETGCGKTTSAQILSEGNLLSINCHERTETSDLLGSIRPNFDGSFYWQDGVVVQAMKNGSKLLIDEISLAADSVLERLNPLLEANRTILLTDAGASAEKVVANEKFQIIATMNPGTDHGKKELSKALRNRFTEIWCNCDYPIEDIRQILSTRMSKHGENIIDDEFGKSINAI
uniref:AAA+ ATPase domain-containing protein n=1 Tax=Panagrolaimus sp. JU765 TaxID=591449 RepID=A0AC34QC40_9BILA